MCASDKGGVGKSFWTVNYVQWLTDTRRVFRAIDPDNTNSTLTRFHPNSLFVDVSNPESMDQIALSFDEVPLVAVDGMGGQKGVFLKWMESVDLFSIAPELGIQITFVIVVDEDKDTVFQAGETLKQIGKEVDWVIVRNLKTVGKTSMWDKSDARKLAYDLGAREITFPKFDEHLVARLQEANMPISRAVDDTRFNLLDRQRCKKYAEANFHDAFEANADVLTADGDAEPADGGDEDDE